MHRRLQFDCSTSNFGVGVKISNVLAETHWSGTGLSERPIPPAPMHPVFIVAR